MVKGRKNCGDDGGLAIQVALRMTSKAEMPDHAAIAPVHGRENAIRRRLW